MTGEASERPLSLLLAIGSGIAALLVAAGIAAGLVLPTGSSAGAILDLVGVGLFVGLPLARVILMLVLFIRQRDFVLGAVALAVLLFIAVGSTAAAMLEH